MILPVLHFCSKDERLAIAALNASAKLCGKLNAELLLAFDSETKHEAVLEVANKAFSVVVVFTYDPLHGEKTWPRPQNHAWQSVARHLNTLETKLRGWLWWEPDACPIRNGWLEKLAAEYKRARKSFGGAPCVSPVGSRYMNGVGIYPFNIVDAVADCAALYTRSVPFDIAAGSCVMRDFVDLSKLIIHKRKDAGGTSGIALTNQVLDMVLSTNPDAVFFHGAGTSQAPAIKKTEFSEIKPSILQLLVAWKNSKSSSAKALTFVSRRAEKPKYVHCVERHATNPDNTRRILAAFNSWVGLYKSGRMIPCHVWDFYRHSGQIGDERNLPYIKDILAEGMVKARDNDYVLLSNDDTIMHPKLLEALDQILQSVPATCSMRLNFNPGSLPELSNPPEYFLSVGENDLGRDIFVFRKTWLQENWHNIPDFFLGELEWDLVLTSMVRISAGAPVDWQTITFPLHTCELARGYVFHEAHQRLWTMPKLAQAPAKKHNRKQSVLWYSANNLSGMIPV